MPIFHDETRNDPDNEEHVFGRESIRLSGSNDESFTVSSDDWNFGSGDFTISGNHPWTNNFFPPTRKLTQSQKLKLQGKL